MKKLAFPILIILLVFIFAVFIPTQASPVAETTEIVPPPINTCYMYNGEIVCPPGVEPGDTGSITYCRPGIYNQGCPPPTPQPTRCSDIHPGCIYENPWPTEPAYPGIEEPAYPGIGIDMFYSAEQEPEFIPTPTVMRVITIRGRGKG